ncbi:MAG: transcription antitermination factor NusB [Cyanobacteria bacterium P01_A01_bin.135]
MQPRRAARELALLSLGQSVSHNKRQRQDLQTLLVSAVRVLTTEVQQSLESATSELERGSDRLLRSEIHAIDVKSARTMVHEAIAQTQSAVNRLGIALDLPEIIQLSNQHEVRDYALELLETVKRRQTDLDQQLNAAMVDWQMGRLARIDQDILRIAAAELLILETPAQVAINEAVELAKRYSGEDGYRFINGVLRRLSSAAPSAPR